MRKVKHIVLILLMFFMIISPGNYQVYASSGIDLVGTDGWIPVLPANSQFDYVGDQQTGSGSVSQDIVGDATYPVFYVNYDRNSNEIGFRFRLNANDSNDKDTGSGKYSFGNFAFVGVDYDLNGSIDFFVGVYNPSGNGRIGIYDSDPSKLNDSPSTTGIKSNPPLREYAPTSSNYSLMLANDHSRFSGDDDYLVSFKVPVSDINSAKSINISSSTPLQYIIGTAAQDNSFNQDLAGIGKFSMQDTTKWVDLGVFSPVVTPDGVKANSAPIAKDDSQTTVQDTSLTINVLANDTDADGNISESTVAVKAGPAHGSTAVDAATGQITYTPDSNYSGTDSFTYTVKDSSGLESNEATVNITVTAVLQSYTVTFDNNDGAPDLNPTMRTIADGEVVGDLPPGPSRTGYNFAGWNTQADGMGTDVDASTVVTGNLTVYAQWTATTDPIPTYTVRYDGNGSTVGSVPTDSNHYEQGTTVTVQGNMGGLVKTGYTFAGWNTAANGSGTAYTADSTLTMGSGNVILYAQWAANQYTVSFNSNGGSAVAAQQVEHNGQVSQPVDPTKTGYSFAGWYTDNRFTTDFDFQNTPITANTTIYAKWGANQYTVSFNSNGGSEVAAQQVEHYGQASQPLAPTKEGYSFAGWYTDNTRTTAFDFTNTPITANTTIYAEWNINSYTVTFDANGGDTDASPATKPVRHGGTIDVLPTEPTKQWYTFAGWNTQADGQGTPFDAKTIVTGEMTVYAKWVLNTALDGWPGNSTILEFKEPIVAPGDPLKLNAHTSDNIETLIASFSYVNKNQQTAVEKIELSLKAEGNNTKEWHSVDYRLPYAVPSGQYSLSFVGYNTEKQEFQELTQQKVNNTFTVISEIDLAGKVNTLNDGEGQTPIEGAVVTLTDPNGNTKVAETVTNSLGEYEFINVKTRNYLIQVKKSGYSTSSKIIHALPEQVDQKQVVVNFNLVDFKIHLSANPTAIVGDGHSTTILTAEILDKNNQPIPDVNVTFEAAKGTFLQGKSKTTNESGKASIVYQSINIEGINSLVIPVKVTVNDTNKKLFAEEELLITFEPASIKGVVTNTNRETGERVPVAGAIVKVSKDFDGDGTIDFAAQAITGMDGKYSIAIPRGGVEYNLDITKPVQIGDSIKNVTFSQVVDLLDVKVTGSGNEEFSPNNTATGLIGSKTIDGKSGMLSEQVRDITKIYLMDENGDYVLENGNRKAFRLNAEGVFNAEGLSKGKYKLVVKLEINDEELTINKKADGDFPELEVRDDGEINISEELIDPYGDITDKNTGALISDAFVQLWFADTDRNRQNGRDLTKPVTLPKLPGFLPNDNENPQYSKQGKYAYMVYGKTDYYLTVSKAGYKPYTSPTISVEEAIVRHDIQMVPTSSRSGGSSGGGSSSGVSASSNKNLLVSISADHPRYEEGSVITYTITYKNPSKESRRDVQLEALIPEGTEWMEDGTGAEKEGKVFWNISTLGAGESGNAIYKVKLKEGFSKEKEWLVSNAVHIYPNGENSTIGEAESSIDVLVFTNKYGNGEHEPYILGYPDKKFKPGRYITRAEIAAIFSRIMDIHETKVNQAYTDLQPGHWAYQAIQAVTDKNLFNGYNDQTFLPNKPIKRGELASVISRYLKLQGNDPIESHFVDIDNHWAKNDIEELFRYHITKGYQTILSSQMII